uniref:Uncharacterized protein n=1 Tax=viral metagenome TaxID=1070528 RepID=A0A6C0C2Z8_9ZZZZ
MTSIVSDTPDDIKKKFNTFKKNWFHTIKLGICDKNFDNKEIIDFIQNWEDKEFIKDWLIEQLNELPDWVEIKDDIIDSQDLKEDFEEFKNNYYEVILKHLRVFKSDIYLETKTAKKGIASDNCPFLTLNVASKFKSSKKGGKRRKKKTRRKRGANERRAEENRRRRRRRRNTRCSLPNCNIQGGRRRKKKTRKRMGGMTEEEALEKALDEYIIALMTLRCKYDALEKTEKNAIQLGIEAEALGNEYRKLIGVLTGEDHREEGAGGVSEEGGKTRKRMGGMPVRSSSSTRRRPPKEFFLDKDETLRQEPLPDDTVIQHPHYEETPLPLAQGPRWRERSLMERDEFGKTHGWIVENQTDGRDDGIIVPISQGRPKQACCSPCQKGWCDTIMGRCAPTKKTEIGPVKHCRACISHDGQTWHPDRQYKKKCLKPDEAFDDNDNAKFIKYIGGGKRRKKKTRKKRK